MCLGTTTYFSQLIRGGFVFDGVQAGQQHDEAGPAMTSLLAVWDGATPRLYMSPLPPIRLDLAVTRSMHVIHAGCIMPLTQ